MDLRSFAQAIRKFWWLIVLITLLGAGGAIVITLNTAPKYASSVTFFVSTPSSADGNALQADQFAQFRVNSYVELLRSGQLADLVAREPGVGLTSAEVTRHISASARTNTVLLSATATDTSKARALAITTAIAKTFPAMVNRLDQRSSKTTTVLNVVSGPTLSNTPISPRRTLNIGLGILIGLALGLAAAFLRELTDTTMRSVEAVEAAAGFPVIGTINFEKGAKKAPLIVEGSTRGGRGEAIRKLRTNLQFVDVDDPVRVIVVTSSVAGEGKSTTAANLAIMLAETGQRILLIEADLRRPRLAEYLGLERAVGLTNVAAGQVSIDDVLQPWGAGGLTVLASGSIPPNPSELLGSHSMRDIISSLRERFEMIIIDTPPLLPVTDGAVVAAFADGVVVVVRYGKTSRSQLAQSIKALESVDARVLGAVLNMRPMKEWAKRRHDEYGYYQDSRDADPMRRRGGRGVTKLRGADTRSTAEGEGESEPSPTSRDHAARHTDLDEILGDGESAAQAEDSRTRSRDEAGTATRATPAVTSLRRAARTLRPTPHGRPRDTTKPRAEDDPAASFRETRPSA
jgi:capsular exopolysaccharide synthesis family protein